MHAKMMLAMGLVLTLLLGACGGTGEDKATATTRSDSIGQQVTATTAAPEPTDPPEAPTSTIAPTSTPEPTATATLMPTPVPTNTPVPTATPKPTNTPTPEPTATPTPQPVVYSGNGTNVIDIQKPGDVVIAYIRGNAESRYFGVESFDDAGEQVDLLVNTTDPYEGVVLMDIRKDEHSTRLQITAEGDWYIELRPLSTARRLTIPGTIDGTGDDVFIIDGKPDVAHIIGNADERYFGVFGYGDRSHLIVNTTDAYDGRTILARDIILIEVKAEGGWSITFE